MIFTKVFFFTKLNLFTESDEQNISTKLFFTESDGINTVFKLIGDVNC